MAGLALHHASTERFQASFSQKWADHRSNSTIGRHSVELLSTSKPAAAEDSVSPILTPEADARSTDTLEEHPVHPLVNGSSEVLSTITSRREVSTTSAVAESSEQVVDNFRYQTINVVVAFLSNFLSQERLPFPNSSLREFSEAVANLCKQDRELSSVEKAMIEIAKLMNSQNGDSFRQLALQVAVDTDLPNNYMDIASEVFVENSPDRTEFTWSRLVALFLFTGRVAAQCIQMEAGSLVWPMSLNLIKLIVGDLRPHIERLGGWDAFLVFADVIRNRSNAAQPRGGHKHGGRLRKLWSQVISVTATGLGLSSDEESETNPQATSPSALLKSAWFAPLALGAAGALLTAYASR